MGLLTILRKIKQKEKEIRILILGLDNAGKTTILRRMLGETIDSIEPTLGFSIHTLEYLNYHLNLWDIGGQKSIRAYWKNYFEQTDGVIWVVDSADRLRLELCREELFEQILIQERLAGASLLILANKQDVAGACSSDELSSMFQLSTPRISNRHWSIHPCSGMTGEGLKEGLDWIVRDIASRYFLLG